MKMPSCVPRPQAIPAPACQATQRPPPSWPSTQTSFAPAGATRASPHRPSAAPWPQRTGRPAGTWSPRRRPEDRYRRRRRGSADAARSRAAAIRKNMAYADHPQAAMMPSDTSVSIEHEPCRAFLRALRWKGHAAHSPTGAVRSASTHCAREPVRREQRQQHRQIAQRDEETSSSDTRQKPARVAVLDRADKDLHGSTDRGGDAGLRRRLIHRGDNVANLIELFLDPGRAGCDVIPLNRQLDLPHRLTSH